MMSFYRLPRRVAVSVAVVTLVTMAAAVAIGLAYPEQVSSGALGPDWQCSRLALVFTTCARVAGPKLASVATGMAPSCRRALTRQDAMRVQP